MKKLIAMMMLAVIMVGCQKKVDIGELTLGGSIADAKSALSYNHIDLWENNDSIAQGDGEIELMGIEWNNIRCEFKDDKLVAVSMWRTFSNLSKYQIESLKEQLRELCGDGFSDTEKMVAGYGTSSDNNGCMGGIKVVWDDYDDTFFATIRLAD